MGWGKSSAPCELPATRGQEWGLQAGGLGLRWQGCACPGWDRQPCHPRSVMAVVGVPDAVTPRGMAGLPRTAGGERAVG